MVKTGATRVWRSRRLPRARTLRTSTQSTVLLISVFQRLRGVLCAVVCCARQDSERSDALHSPLTTASSKRWVAKRRNGRPGDTRRIYSRIPSKARAQASNVSPPMKANNTSHRQPARARSSQCPHPRWLQAQQHRTPSVIDRHAALLGP